MIEPVSPDLHRSSCVSAIYSYDDTSKATLTPERDIPPGEGETLPPP